MIRVRLNGADFFNSTSLPLSVETVHYLTRVHRQNSGSVVIAFDGNGWEVDVRLDYNGSDWCAQIVGPVRRGVHGGPLMLCFGLAKGEKIEQVVRQACELGVGAVELVQTKRCVVRLDGKRAAKRVERLIKIAAEASRQCGRADTMTIGGPSDLEQLGKTLPASGSRIVLHPHEGQNIDDVHLQAPCTILVGPEGGFADEELRHLEQEGWVRITLRSPVLRAETAATVGSAIALHRLGHV